MLQTSKTSEKSDTCRERQTVYNIQHSENFTVLSNDLLQDFTLSPQAFRILVYLLSKPKGWRIYQSHLMECTGKSRRTVQCYMSELKKSGYVTYTRLRKFDHNDPTADQGYYSVFEKPKNQLRDEQYHVADASSANDSLEEITECPAPVNAVSETPVVDPDKELKKVIDDLSRNHQVTGDDEIFLQRKSNDYFNTLTCKFRSDKYFSYMARGFDWNLRQNIRYMKTENIKDQKNTELNNLIKAQAEQLKRQASKLRNNHGSRADATRDFDLRDNDLNTVYDGNDSEGLTGGQPEYYGYVIDV